jgi:hypothetical protein
MQERRQSSYVFVQDIKLAATLLTLGFEPYQQEPVTAVSKDGRQPTYLFNFEPREGINDYIKAWYLSGESYPEKPGHELNRADHPFWKYRQVLQNREHLLDRVKNADVSVYFERAKGSVIIKTRPKYEH